MSARPLKISRSTGCGNYRKNSLEFKIDIYAVLPDHIHLILVIPGGHAGPPRTGNDELVQDPDRPMRISGVSRAAACRHFRSNSGSGAITTTLSATTPTWRRPASTSSATP